MLQEKNTELPGKAREYAEGFQTPFGDYLFQLLKEDHHHLPKKKKREKRKNISSQENRNLKCYSKNKDSASQTRLFLEIHKESFEAWPQRLTIAISRVKETPVSPQCKGINQF